MLVAGALAGATSLVTAASGCGSFGEAQAPSDGGAAGDAVAEPPRNRNVVVAPGWPTVTALDPGKDPRLATTVVTVIDAVDTSRRVEKAFPATDKGPYAFADVFTTNVVDATVELREGSGRVLGYGERRRWNLSASETVPVAARKRLLYFTSGDRDDGQLRMLDLAPESMAEPGMEELDEPALASLTSPAGLYTTADGLLLVQAGQARLAGGGAGVGRLAVFETGTHAPAKTIDLPNPLSAVLPLGDGHQLLGAPGRDATTTTFTLVAVDTGVVTPLPTGLQGGAIRIASMAASPDGTHVAAVGTRVDGADEAPYAFTYDVGAPSMSNTPLAALVDVARGVRFTPDGKTVVVAGAKDGASWATGSLLFFAVGSGSLAQPTRTIALAAGVTRPSSLVIDPAGAYAYVGNETHYTNNSSCCGDLRVIDLAAGQESALYAYGATGPELELTEVIRLPYGPRRVIAGQSDNGNNVHGPFVELVAKPTPAAIKTTAHGDVGSIDGLATPFGSRL